MSEKVLIMRCDDYDPGKIAGIVKEGMEQLGAKPYGKTLMKPNTVLAHPEWFPHAFTRSEFIDGVIAAVKENDESIEELVLGERCGITIPTRYVFKQAGYMPVLKKHGIKPSYFDEVKQVPVRLGKKENLRDEMFVPKPIAECDFLINLPKFKAHPWTRLTLSLKNFIGIQDDRHRLVDHNIFLEHKIADLQEVIQPKFIAIDAIIAGQKMMLTPTPFNMGAIVMGVNSCAVDAVCCHMVNIAPEDLIHLRISSERGLGPMDLNEIEVEGDFPLEEVQHKNKGFEFCMEHIDDYFKDHPNLSATVGSFPEAHSPDYCWGGCPGAIQEAMHVFKSFDPDVNEKMKKIRVVVGKVDGPLDVRKDEKVIFVGDCCQWEGNVNGDKVEIGSSYIPPSEVDQRKTKSNDMILKILGAKLDALRHRSDSHVHLKGCTVAVSRFVTYMSSFARIGDPNFVPKLAVPVNIAYWQMRTMRFINRVFG